MLLFTPLYTDMFIYGIAVLPEFTAYIANSGWGEVILWI